MKTLKTLTLLFTMATLIASCSKNTNNGLSEQVNSENLKQGTWTVSHYSEKGKDETYKFDGYEILFYDDGTFSLNKNGILFSGSWSVTSSDDNSSGSTRLTLIISGNKLAEHLHDNWIIIEMNEFKIRLMDDNSSHSEILELINS